MEYTGFGSLFGNEVFIIAETILPMAALSEKEFFGIGVMYFKGKPTINITLSPTYIWASPNMKLKVFKVS